MKFHPGLGGPTPLYDSLLHLAQANTLQLNMPGHHGKPLAVEGLWPSALDFTENGSTGDLFGSGGDAIEEAEQLWAKAVGMDQCLFLTGGSTQGVHTGLALLAGIGGHVALDRGSHRSAYNALGLLDLTPHYLPRPWLEEEGVTGPIQPETVEDTLRHHPEIKTICITSPTYYGVLSDLPAIGAVCRRHGARLMVDGAHGAHLPFLGYTGYQAADVVVLSAHKTLAAPGQSALLLARGMDMDTLRQVGSVYGSSSPSYVMMAALDVVRAHMEGAGGLAYRQAAQRTDRLRLRYPSLRPAGLELDPTRLVLCCGDGDRLAASLREQGVYPEMSDVGHVVLILTGADTDRDEARLCQALEQCWQPGTPSRCPPPPPPPPQVLTPRQALFAPRRRVAWEACAGQVAAVQLAPYPPGIPVVAPGEKLEKKHLVYLEEMGYNVQCTDVVLPSWEVGATQYIKGDDL